MSHPIAIASCIAFASDRLDRSSHATTTPLQGSSLDMPVGFASLLLAVKFFARLFAELFVGSEHGMRSRAIYCKRGAAEAGPYKLN